MSLLLVATGLVTYRYASRRLGHGLTSAAVALVIFHAASLDFKQFVLSDIPFTLVTIWFLDSAEESSALPWAIALAVAAWLVRSVGVVVVGAWVCDAMARTVLTRDEPKRVRAYLLAAFAVSGIIVLFWLFMGETQGYNSAMQQWTPFATIREQFLVNRDLFALYLGGLFGFALRPLVAPCVMVLLVIGAWTSARDGRTLGLWFCALYVALLLANPIPTGGYRLILPLLPVGWTYVARGWLKLAERMPAKALVAPAFAVILIVLTARQVYEFTVRPVLPSVHPESTAAVELYVAMQQAILPEDLTLSGKPRALALFAQRKGISLSPGASDAAVEKLVADRNVQYVISGESFRNAAVTRYCAVHSDRVIFRNEAFSICKTR